MTTNVHQNHVLSERNYNKVAEQSENEVKDHSVALSLAIFITQSEN